MELIKIDKGEKIEVDKDFIILLAKKVTELTKRTEILAKDIIFLRNKMISYEQSQMKKGLQKMFDEIMSKI